MSDPNTYTPDWRVDVEPEQANDYDSTDESDTDTSSDGSQGDEESE